MKYDTLIRQALIIDGSNTPATSPMWDARRAYRTIGDLSAARGEHEIDAAGRVLAPGFIDVHTHDDTVVIRQPQMLPKLSQGVTTVIVGNCGSALRRSVCAVIRRTR
jgi:N-acyl-D-amino-acid deacylase